MYFEICISLHLELYNKYLEDRSKFSSNIKISKTSTDPQTDKNTKLDNYDRKYKEKYTNDVCNFYESCLNDIDRSDIDKSLKRLQKNNLNNEFNKFKDNPDFCYQDIFQKHSSFCFSMNEPMSADTIRNVRREIMNTLGIKIPYEHPIFQMLKRGIGLYIETMPDEYKWILQKLLSNKQIGIVISDKTLCMGIDLPVRTCCLMEFNGSNNFTNEDYLQMSGRAGRRGQDNRGNVIFYGESSSVKQLMIMFKHWHSINNITRSSSTVRINMRCLKIKLVLIFKFCTADCTFIIISF